MLCPWCMRDVSNPHFCEQKPKGPSVKVDFVKLWLKIFGEKHGHYSTIDKKIEILERNKESFTQKDFEEELKKLQKLKRVSDIINRK